MRDESEPRMSLRSSGLRWLTSATPIAFASSSGMTRVRGAATGCTRHIRSTSGDDATGASHMKIPEEFEQLVRGIDPEGPKLESLQSLATAALRYRDDDDLRAVLPYLNELLDGRHSDAELHYVWRKQSPRYDFSP